MPKYIPREMKVYVHAKTCTKCSENIIHNTQKLKITQMSIKCWAEETVYPYSAMLFHNKTNEVLTHAII